MWWERGPEGRAGRAQGWVLHFLVGHFLKRLAHVYSQPKCRPSGLTEPVLHPPPHPLYLSSTRQSLVTTPDSKSLKPGRSNNKKKGKPATFFLWTNININAMKNIHVKTTTVIIHLISRYSFSPLITPEKKKKKEVAFETHRARPRVVF